MSPTDTIKTLTPEQRILFLRYGDHARRCVWRLWAEATMPVKRSVLTVQPDCACGWLEVLQEACGGG